MDKVLSELELRFSGNDQEILCVLGNICHSEKPDKESFSRVAELYKIDGEILEAEQKMYAENGGDNAREWSILYVSWIF